MIIDLDRIENMIDSDWKALPINILNTQRIISEPASYHHSLDAAAPNLPAMVDHITNNRTILHLPNETLGIFLCFLDISHFRFTGLACNCTVKFPPTADSKLEVILSE